MFVFLVFWSVFLPIHKTANEFRQPDSTTKDYSRTERKTEKEGEKEGEREEEKMLEGCCSSEAAGETRVLCSSLGSLWVLGISFSSLHSTKLVLNTQCH